MAVLLDTADSMFPEGQNSAPMAITIKGDAAALTNGLLVDASSAVGQLFEARGYDPKKPEVTKAKLGYALDTYDGTAYVMMRHLKMPMPSADDAAIIGKRIANRLQMQDETADACVASGLMVRMSGVSPDTSVYM